MDDKLIRILKNVCKIPYHFLELELCEMDLGNSKVFKNYINKIEIVGDEILTTFKYIDEPIFYWIEGKYGTGKTRIATWLVKQAYLGIRGRSFGFEYDFRPLFMSASQITEYRFNKFDEDPDYDEIRERIFKCSFLAIDDIGKIASYKGEKLFIERVIEERWNEQLSTIITSNVDSKEISMRFDDFISTFDNFVIVGKSRAERNK